MSHSLKVDSTQLKKLARAVRLTLQIWQQLTHHLAEYEVAEQRADERDGHAQHAQQYVRYGQIQQEYVGDGAHPAILHQRQND